MMKLLITKKSGKTFPPPFEGDGKTAIAVDEVVNEYDPKKRPAYLLENGKIVSKDVCKIVSKDICK